MVQMSVVDIQAWVAIPRNEESSVADPDQHNFGKPDPDPRKSAKPDSDPHQSQQGDTDPDPYHIQNSRDVESQNGATEDHGRSQ